jgi:serine/threonine protein kinase
MDTGHEPPNHAFVPSPLHYRELQLSSEPWAISFTRRTYKEDKERGKEPMQRWLELVLYSFTSKWHVKVTFQGTLAHATDTVSKVTRRRRDLENLCLCIDFKLIRLFDDTVTELIVTQRCDTTTTPGQKIPLKTSPQTESEYAHIIGHLCFYTREDPFRVRFPVYDNCGRSTPIKHLSEIGTKEELGPGVSKVKVGSDQTSYIYKEVDRLLYEPKDTEILEKELQNLELLRGSNGVVQLIAVVLSNNPYQTTKPLQSETPTVLRGILLEYHPNGTLQDALDVPSPKPNYRWLQWAIEITGTVALFHRLGITVMDLKPSNIVISEHLNAILIDVSGIGGVTRKWLSPEMQVLSEPLSQDMESRTQNDIWAVGLILSAMADASYNKIEAQVLREVGLEATAEVPQHVLSKLLQLYPSSS